MPKTSKTISPVYLRAIPAAAACAATLSKTSKTISPVYLRAIPGAAGCAPTLSKTSKTISPVYLRAIPAAAGCAPTLPKTLKTIRILYLRAIPAAAECAPTLPKTLKTIRILYLRAIRLGAPPLSGIRPKPPGSPVSERSDPDLAGGRHSWRRGSVGAAGEACWRLVPAARSLSARHLSRPRAKSFPAGGRHVRGSQNP